VKTLLASLCGVIPAIVAPGKKKKLSFYYINQRLTLTHAQRPVMNDPRPVANTQRLGIRSRRNVAFRAPGLARLITGNRLPVTQPP
jgi:hypothetical protein